ncbi:MAG: cytochrome c3 family protein [Moraxellaceae bacterium]
MKIIVTTITRSPRGNPMRATREITGDQIRIGRGAECELRLADPRVPLHARSISMGRSGPQLFDAADLNAEVTGVFRAQFLKPGTSLKIGPFQLDITEPGDADLALTLELLQPLPGKTKLSASDIYEYARHAPISKRTASWALFSFILVFFLLLPLALFYADSHDQKADAQTLNSVQAQTGLKADAAWNPGELAAAHQPFANNCKTCHSDSFSRVQDKDCLACHQSMGDHVPTKMAKTAGLSDVRCASCHRDHKGAQGLKQQITHYFMGECSACHQDIKQHWPETKTENVSDFARAHPDFRVSFVSGMNADGKAEISRSRLGAKSLLTEKRGLKFPHDVHLDPKGVRGPQGLVKTTCNSCHVPDSSGLHFKPVTMKESCQSCHELRFEVAAPERQVPHGNVDEVMSTMREFYSYLAINGIVLNRPQADLPGNDSARGIPGKSAPGALRLSGQADVERQVNIAATEIFEKTTCFSCHNITRQTRGGGKADWHVQPVLADTAWMPKARFSHAKHDMATCESCHAASSSKSAKDVLMPAIKSCQTCHAGTHPERQKISSNCGLCHGFHVINHHAMGLPEMGPGAMSVQKTARDAGMKSPWPAPAAAQ